MLKDFCNKLLEKLKINGRDLTVFLLSFLLAFSIWFIHNLSLDYSSLVSVPVVAESNIDGHSGLSSNAVSIAARCRTTGFNLIRIRHAPGRKSVQVRFAKSDLHYKEGDLYSISSESLGNYVNDIFGDGVSLEAFTSKEVFFRFPSVNHKKVPVQAMRILDFRQQYMAVTDMKLDPDSVIIYGEPFRLAQIDRVRTQTIDLSDIHSSAHGIVRIEKIKGVRISAGEVNYSLDVSRYVEVKDVVPITVRDIPQGKKMAVYPSKATVLFRCIFPLISDPSGKVRFYIDYSDFAASINGRCVPKTGKLPEGVINYVTDPMVFDCVESEK
ncbi:MAG: hypothetical protein LKI42_05465 [Bacteroidales bacterium]|jgi:hypothetical protein|nr:hypothetical protein [Bacteroidales bacterium]MCI1786147.1 hypothetical protein [Bacteroidales bacterium]